MALWIWRNFRIAPPDDWEMLQFSMSPQKGRCAFADRYQFRLELDWQIVPAPPDFQRMMSDYRARLQEQESQDVTITQHGPWHGVSATLHGLSTTRFGRYFGAENCLIEMVFLWPDRKDPRLEQSILDSVEPEPEQAGARRWRAFGMDLLADASLALEHCRVEPAHAELLFADGKRRRTERFARRGMVPDWLNEPIDAWLRRWVNRDLQDISADCLDSEAHRVHRLRGQQSGGLLDRQLTCSAAAWICPADGRLYSFARTWTRPAAQELAAAPPRLSCCPRWKL